jgi:sulfur carrier protein ThiS
LPQLTLFSKLSQTLIKNTHILTLQTFGLLGDEGEERMEIHIEREQTTKSINFNGTVAELLKELNINPETVLTLRNNEVITEEVFINNNDSIKILSTISGG